MKIKTSELTGVALDWAVGVADGKQNDIEVHGGNVWYGRVTSGFVVWQPTVSWAQGGPIIEREEITIDYRDSETQARKWAGDNFVEARARKRQGLIAAMRCYCCAKLGDEIEVPEELI